MPAYLYHFTSKWMQVPKFRHIQTQITQQVPKAYFCAPFRLLPVEKGGLIEHAEKVEFIEHVEKGDLLSM